MTKLFQEYTLRDITFRNRLWVSAMCQYSSEDGMPSDWHLVHLGSRAVGGAGLVMTEAAAVSPEGRITPQDAGIWSDAHAYAFEPIVKFIKAQGAIAGIQLAHAGRKASTAPPWEGGGKVDETQGGWQTVAPSALKFDTNFPDPREMSEEDIGRTVDDFVAAAKRSVQVGFEVIEIHAAHGYLCHEFLSPLSNQRTDQYGGSLENRMRFPLLIAKTVRAVVPRNLPVFVRISATDWVEGGWDLEQSIEFCKELKKLKIDLVDTSCGGNVPNAKVVLGPSYQVPFTDAIRKQADIATTAVGRITDAKQAEGILQNDQADAIFVARQFLRDPYFALHAAQELGEKVNPPKQYRRAID